MFREEDLVDRELPWDLRDVKEDSQLKYRLLWEIDFMSPARSQ